MAEKALNPEPMQGRHPDKEEYERRKELKNAENKQILTACVTFNNMATLELLLQPVMQKLTMAADDKFFEQLLENTAQGAPKILGAILRRGEKRRRRQLSIRLGGPCGRFGDGRRRVGGRGEVVGGD